MDLYYALVNFLVDLRFIEETNLNTRELKILPHDDALMTTSIKELLSRLEEKFHPEIDRQSFSILNKLVDEDLYNETSMCLFVNQLFRLLERNRLSLQYGHSLVSSDPIVLCSNKYAENELKTIL